VALTSAGDTGVVVTSAEDIGVVVTSMEATSGAGEAGSAGASALASCLDLERPTTRIIRITPIMETASCKGGG
jgi:hypothetical protein